MRADAGSLISAIGFGIWLLTTIACQFTSLRLSNFLRRYDYCGVIPVWTFFAPNPAVQDFTLMFRDRDSSGETTPWKQFAYLPPHPLVRWLWNPAKRRSKLIHDMATVWLRSAINDPLNPAIVLSIPYLSLLHQVSVAPRDGFAVATQMAIASVHSQQADKPAEVFI